MLMSFLRVSLLEVGLKDSQKDNRHQGEPESYFETNPYGWLRQESGRVLLLVSS